LFASASSYFSVSSVCVRDFEETNQPKKLNWKLDGWMYVPERVRAHERSPAQSLFFSSVPFRSGAASPVACPMPWMERDQPKLYLGTGSSETKDTTQGSLCMNLPAVVLPPNEICIRTALLPAIDQKMFCETSIFQDTKFCAKNQA
jgi:hypothetical protein